MKIIKREECIHNVVCKYDDGMCPLECVYYEKADVWLDFEKEKPIYNKLKNGNLETSYLLVSTKHGEMAVASHSINYTGNGSLFEWWDVSGVSGYEWEFDLKYDIKYWRPLPDSPTYKG